MKPAGKGGGCAYKQTMLFRLANRRLLVKCYDNKMV